jgi:hypothetical protein
MGAEVISYHTTGYRVRAALSRQLDDDDACERLSRIVGPADGREFWSNLDRGCDDVRSNSFGAVTVRIRPDNRFNRIISVGVVGLWPAPADGGSVAARVETGRLAVTHTSKGGEFSKEGQPRKKKAKKEDKLLDFPPSPSPTFMGLLQTPQTPRLDFRGRVRSAPGGGP